MSDVLARLQTEEDYIPLQRFGFSLRKLLDKHPDGVPAAVIAQCLMIDEEDVEGLYQEVVEEMRVALKVER